MCTEEVVLTEQNDHLSHEILNFGFTLLIRVCVCVCVCVCEKESMSFSILASCLTESALALADWWCELVD